ncbi:MAG: nucleoside triphosphate pyrophosphohydrolase [Bacteroidales bacterium]|nr:nucleoside triphosphate pyrophosphohydrolase [Bacteroidales bacterium]
MTDNDIQAFKRLGDILDILRQKCPWDRVQTMESLRYLTIEETYELSEAILNLNSGDEAPQEMKKELGDLFMHLLFYTKIAEEKQLFSTADVLNAICDKLVSRHPFIFQPDTYDGESWEQIKMHEGRKSVLEGVPASLPPLVKAVRLQEKAAGIGVEPVLADGQDATTQTPLPDETPTEETFGNLLFNLIHWAHEHGINADTALARANLQFQDKVKTFEQQAANN